MEASVGVSIDFYGVSAKRTISPAGAGLSGVKNWNLKFTSKDGFDPITETIDVDAQQPEISKSIPLPTGSYVLSVQGTTESFTDADAFTYAGSTEFTLLEGEKKDVRVSVSLLKTENGKGSFSYILNLNDVPDEFKKITTSYYGGDASDTLIEKMSLEPKPSLTLERLSNGSENSPISIVGSVIYSDNPETSPRIQVGPGATIPGTDIEYTAYTTKTETPTSFTFSKNDIPSGFYRISLSVDFKDDTDYSVNVNIGDTLLEIVDEKVTSGKAAAGKINLAPIFYCDVNSNDSSYNGLSGKYPASFDTILERADSYDGVSVEVRCKGNPNVKLWKVPLKKVNVHIENQGKYTHAFKLYKDVDGGVKIEMAAGSTVNPSLEGNDKVKKASIDGLAEGALSLDGVDLAVDISDGGAFACREIILKQSSTVHVKSSSPTIAQGERITVKVGQNPWLSYTREKPFFTFEDDAKDPGYAFTVKEADSDENSAEIAKAVGTTAKSGDVYSGSFFMLPFATGTVSVGSAIPVFSIKVGEIELAGAAHTQDGALSGEIKDVPYKDFDYELSCSFTGDQPRNLTLEYLVNGTPLEKGSDGKVLLNLAKSNFTGLDADSNTLECIAFDGNGGWRSVVALFKPVADIASGTPYNVLFTGQKAKGVLGNALAGIDERELKDYAITTDGMLYTLSYGNSCYYVDKWTSDYRGELSEPESIMKNPQSSTNIAANKNIVLVFSPVSSSSSYNLTAFYNGEEIANVTGDLNLNDSEDTVQAAYLDDENRLFVTYGKFKTNSDNNETSASLHCAWGTVSYDENSHTLTYTGNGTLKIASCVYDLLTGNIKDDTENALSGASFVTVDTRLYDMHSFGDKLYMLASNHKPGVCPDTTDETPLEKARGVSNGAVLCFDIGGPSLSLDASFNGGGYFGYKQDASASKPGNFFYGPSKIVALKPRGFVIADEGGYSETLQSGDFHDVDRLVTVDLENLTFTVTDSNPGDCKFRDRYDPSGLSFEHDGISRYTAYFSSY